MNQYEGNERGYKRKRDAGRKEEEIESCTLK